VPGQRFTISSYVPQIGAGTSPYLASILTTAADLAWAVTEQTSFNNLQQLVYQTTFSDPQRTDAAQIALLNIGSATRLTDASIATKGLTAVLWEQAIDWQAGYAAALALLPSL
jgi:hypothetical protein